MELKNSVFILTGMHRSGTSIVGKFLLRSGIDMGQNLLGPSHGNPHGYFEDIELLHFHQRIMKRVCGWHDFYQMRAKEIPTLTEKDRAVALQIIKKREARNKTWGWKDPRTCLFLDFWAELIPHAKFLFVFREPCLVVDSTARREKTFSWNRRKLDKYLSAWIFYNQALLRFYAMNKNRSILFSLNHINIASE